MESCVRFTVSYGIMVIYGSRQSSVAAFAPLTNALIFLSLLSFHFFLSVSTILALVNGQPVRGGARHVLLPLPHPSSLIAHFRHH